ncbi:hypothetical protein GCM10027440_34280 [Nocardiopsis coralliicola]
MPAHRAGLSAPTADRARHEVLLAHPDGRRLWGGIDAVAALLVSSPVAAVRPLGALLRTRPLRPAGAAAYRWVARNRHRMPGGTAACAVTAPPAD